MLENTLECLLDCKRINSVNPKGNQSWIFIGRADVEAETPVLWPPDVKNCLIWKYADAAKDLRQEKKGTTEDEVVGWHHRLNAHGFEHVLGVGDGQGGLVCCSPWGRKESEMTERPKWTELRWYLSFSVWLTAFSVIISSSFYEKILRGFSESRGVWGMPSRERKEHDTFQDRKRQYLEGVGRR